jgi:hypothetical protein
MTLLDPDPSHTEVFMRRIGLAVVLAVMCLAPLAAEAQSAGKVHRIGYLSPENFFHTNVNIRPS